MLRPHPNRRTKSCFSTDFVYGYRVDTADGEVLRTFDIPDEVPDGAVFWRRYGNTWVEIPRPTAAEYETAF